MHIYLYVCIEAGNSTAIRDTICVLTCKYPYLRISSDLFVMKAGLNILRLTY